MATKKNSKTEAGKTDKPKVRGAIETTVDQLTEAEYSKRIKACDRYINDPKTDVLVVESLRRINAKYRKFYNKL